MEKVTKETRKVHLGLVILMVGFFLIDSILMFFIEPGFGYILAAVPVMALIAFILYKIRRDLVMKEIRMLHGYSMIFASMTLNLIVDLIRVNTL